MKKLLFLLSLIPFTIFAQKNDTLPNAKYGLFHNFGKNAYQSIIGKSSLYYAVGIALTYGLVVSDLDAQVNTIANGFGDWSTYTFAVPLVSGFVAPVLVPLSMRIFSKNEKVRRASNAGLQAALISFSYNSILKGITGRRPPMDLDFMGTKEALSREFRFGFLEGGIYEGWPSGHSMTNMAVAAAIAEVYHDKPLVKWIAYGSALTIATGTALGIKGEIHWLSDAVAGTLMGYAIGKTIGRSFRNDLDKKNTISLNMKGLNGFQFKINF